MPGPAHSAIIPYTWLFVAILLRAVNQILMKLSALEWADPATQLLSIGLGAVIICVLVARAYCWQKALADLPLTVAYPFFALTLITLMGSGYMIFGEPITGQNVAGAALICAGIYVIATSSASGDRH